MFAPTPAPRFSLRALTGWGLALLLLAGAGRTSAQAAPEARQQALNQAAELHAAAARFESQADWHRALPLRQEILRLVKGAFGNLAGQTDTARYDLARALDALGQYPEARAVWEQMLLAEVKILKEDAPAVANTLNRIGETFRKEGLLTNSLPYYQRARSILEQTPKPLQILAEVLNNQALASIALGDNAAAEKLLVEALHVLAGIEGINPALRALPLSSLGNVHGNFGQLTTALAEQQAALALLNNLPATHPMRLVVQNNLASAYRGLSQLPQAIAIYTNCLAQLAPLRGAGDLEVLQIRRNLAQALASDGSYATARRLTEAILQDLWTTGRTNLPLFVLVLTDAGARQQECGDLAAARRRYQTALALAPGLVGPDHVLICENRERLAMLALAQMDLAAAHEWLAPALAARQHNAAVDPRRRLELAAGYLEWSKFERVLGRVDQADDFLQQALAIQTKILGTNHPIVADTLEQRGLLAAEGDRLNTALHDHAAAGRIRAAALGESNLLVAQSRMNCADILARQGQVQPALAESRPAAAEVAAQLGPDHLRTLMAEFQLATLEHRAGEFTNAAARYARTLAGFERQDARYAVVAARDAGLLEVDRGNRVAAAGFAERVRVSQNNLWRNRLRFGSEEDRLAGDGHEGVLTLLAEIAPTNPVPLATAVLQWKGAVLDSLVEDRQLASHASDPTYGTNVSALMSARLDRYALELAAGSRQPPSPAAVLAAGAEVERLESQLAQRFSALAENRRASAVTPELVQTSLPPATVLVEYVRYQRWCGGGQTEPAFGALVFCRDRPLRWVALGAAEGPAGIGGLVRQFQTFMHADVPTNSATLLATAQELQDRLWAPVAPLVPQGNDWVIIAPDAELNFVPFAALWRQDHFLAQDYLFRYATSGRDLVAPRQEPPASRTVDIYGAPQFARPAWQRGPAAALAALKALWLVPALRGIPTNSSLPSYDSLAEDAVEAQAVAQAARSNHAVPTVFLQAEATEACVRQRPSPYVLHLATHATFLAASALPGHPALALGCERPGRAQDAMARAWIALAGANETLAAWQRGEPPAPGNDGLLTADEVASLDLGSTWLVTLSACDTGVGIARSGEGVFGLRRAFALAGARHLLVTLWLARDRHNREFMAAFYADAFASNDAPGALARVQRKLLIDWTKTDGAARAQRWAGAYVLSSRGP